MITALVEPGLDARKITNPIAVAVLKRTGIDLVDNAALPPRNILSLVQSVCLQHCGTWVTSIVETSIGR
jgi:hypothetical protein